jgi:hypothetical protein
MIKAFWDAIPREDQAAVIGAIATIAVGFLGAIGLIWQIGRQARSAIEQNKNNESLKLKLKIYEEIIVTCRDASNAVVSMSSYVRLFHTNVILFQQIAQQGLQAVIPDARVPRLIEKKTAVDTAVIEIISLTERWQIIDPRIQIFRVATGAAKYDIDAAWQPYFNVALARMPHEIPGHAQQGTLFPWQPPSEQDSQQLEKIGSDLIDALMILQGYIYDLQIEMQNLLLGELFDRRLPPREPVDPRIAIIRLDQHKKLDEYFNRDTAWGRENARIQAGVRIALRPRHQ